MIKTFVVLAFFVCITSYGQQHTETCSCCSDNHHAFDFWVGEWNVTTPKGQVAGTNKISKEENGCVIHEKWSNGSTGYTGTSLNFYNNVSGKWEQVWVDNAGTFLKLSGNRIGNRMILSSKEFTKADGKLYRNRITWTKNEDGTVRQLWELLLKDEVVSVLFDGLYKRK